MSQPQPHPESDLLTPLHPVHDADPDHWPEFEVTNARVTTPDSDDLVPLLTATEHNPLVLTGSLQPLSDEYRNRYIGQGTRRSDTIRVPGVRLFAYGQYADGSVVLWAAGQAGWYTIKPARPYRSIYTRMVEGVKMLYFVADMYREERKQGKGKNATPLPPYTAEELFEQYALEMWDDTSRMEEARGIIEDHRDFLITSMLGGKEGMDWKKNPLYLYFKKTFPQDHDAILYRIAGPGKKSTAAQRVARQQSVDSTSTKNTWTCALDGCTHKIYLASEPGSQRLTREHYKLHAYDDDERVRLVGRLQAPSLPVGHLMERVRLVARRREGGGQQEEVGGDVWGGAEDVEGEEMKDGKQGEKEKEMVLDSSHKAERAKMPSSRYPPPALAPTTTATATAAIEPIVQRY
ncbi:hypothetical protein BTJ68_07971 [Hortaea werneckii EXF-2000]|uniref:DNA (cytosine-5)-methyltransferase 1 replication foci domain-containing protein n=1 Tax=Hortaea werneckii EXF-2000 TaxID=1157616 RepID=A0A1Z5T8Q1_HORWE|nr:hypothetical protein BTJ68_07971 [Hortaea werneckii EXF-2000]